jgi:hypothetical protein
LIPVSTEPVLPLHLKLIPLLFTLLGALLAWWLIVSTSNSQLRLITLPTTHEASSSMWYITPISANETLTALKPFHLLLKTIDHGWFEIIGPQGAFSTINSSSLKLISLQSNPITTFLLIATTALIPALILY